MVFKHFFVLVIVLFSCHIRVARAIVDYIDLFIEPEYALSETFPESLGEARENILEWAGHINSVGPWYDDLKTPLAVTTKSITPPSGDKHDYMSWSPYWWPNCTGVGNTTELPPDKVWVTCPYHTRDGVFNPDGRLIDDIGAFSNLADAVLYNALSWVLTGKPTALYAVDVVRFIRTWFLDPATKMNPNLNYAQMARGPAGQTGRHTGILDTKCFTKIITGILILKQGGCALWTPDLDSQMTSWVQQFVEWLETAPTALEEGHAVNNHGSFYYTQLASLKLYLNDAAGALNVTTTYFNNQFRNQIYANGEQPFEAVRTRPYHYRAYNLCAMITNARIQNYLNKTSNVWNWKTRYGATIQTALDFAMDVPPWISNESSHENEMDPNVAAIIGVYGDPTGKYTNFLQFRESNYTAQPYWFLYQPPDSLAGATQPTNSASFSARCQNQNQGDEVERKTIELLTKSVMVTTSGSLPPVPPANLSQLLTPNIVRDMAPLNSIEQLRVAHAEIRETFGTKVEIATNISDESNIDVNEERELIQQTLENTLNTSIKLKTRLNKLVPINRLPVEIFTYIIHLTNTSIKVLSHPYVSFTWVCHLWRSVLIQDPTFWTLIRRFTYKRVHPFFDELIRRSQSAELDIIFTVEFLDFEPKLEDVFVKESNRIRRLYFFHPDKVLPRVLSGKSFPSLRSFFPDSHGVQHCDITCYLPILNTSNRLESLHCNVGRDTPLDQLASLFSRIRNLSLTIELPQLINPTLDILLVPNDIKLQKLQLRSGKTDTFMPQPQPVVLRIPELRYLSVKDASVLERFRAPKLFSLDVQASTNTTLDYPIFEDFDFSSIKCLYIQGPGTPSYSCIGPYCILGSKEHMECTSSFNNDTKLFDDELFSREHPRDCFHLRFQSKETLLEALRTVSSSTLPRFTNLVELHLLFKYTCIDLEEIISRVPSIEKLVVIEHAHGVQLSDFIRLLRNTSLCPRLAHLSYRAYRLLPNHIQGEKYIAEVGEMLTECLQFRQKASLYALKYISFKNVPHLPQKWLEELQKLGTEVVADR